METTDFDKTGRYRGDIVNCRKDGTGRYIYPGDVYVYDGPWVDGEKHGKNAHFSLPGYSEYSGDFLHGEITGKGKKTWADGRTYDGEWENGEMHGKGSWKSSDGREIYEGEFANNKREGNGSLILRNGDRYSGGFHLHKFHGHGSYLRENVVFIESDFCNGELSGKCQIQWHKIATYHGACLRNRLHGQGYFRCLDGTYEVETKFEENLPAYRVTGYELKIDRSTCVEEIIDPKGKKKEKEKKKPAGKKGSSVMEFEPLISISPGDPIGVLAISIHYTGLDEAQDGLPNADEFRRALAVTLREYTPPATTEHPDTGLGEIVPIWKRNPTLEEYSVAWERFPPRSYRFINGINPLTGASGFEGSPEFSASYDLSVISTQLTAAAASKIRIIVPVSELKSIKTTLSFLLDFKLTPSEVFNGQDSPLLKVSFENINYSSITILSWNLLQDGAPHFSLSLLVADLSDVTWNNCVWELRCNEKTLARWADQSFDVSSWHSIGLTLSLDDKDAEVVNSQLYVDGSGRMKIEKGNQDLFKDLIAYFSSEEHDRVWQIGGEGSVAFDGLVKTFAIFRESDRPDLQEITSCYTAWTAAYSSVGDSPPPQPSETNTDPAMVPPNHSLITSLNVMSCGGKAIVPAILVLPSSLAGGSYVLEVQDMANERCRQPPIAEGSASSVAAGEYEAMSSIIPPASSSRSLFKISVN